MTRTRYLLLFCLSAAACLFAGTGVGAVEPPATRENAEICRQAIAESEKSLDLPFGILQAISLAESGRWDRDSQERFAWPWTVMARGEGKYYPSRAEAIEAVRRLKAEGVRNIDVGCMQVNLHYHPNAFASLEEAFDPAANTRYAGELFAKLREAQRSISRAIAHYHSTTRTYNEPYKKKVMRLWNEERRRHYEAERLRKMAEWKAQRDKRQKLAAN